MAAVEAEGVARVWNERAGERREKRDRPLPVRRV
jgi:retron-type reverse transcriptase